MPTPARLSIALVAAMLAATANADQLPSANIYTAYVDVDITTDGRIESVEMPNPNTTDQFASLLSRAVLGWRFHPVIEDGQAVPASTPLTIRIQAEDGQIPQILDVCTGPRPIHMVAPRYPKDEPRNGPDRTINARFRIGADGQPTAIEYENAGGEGEVRLSMRNAISKALARWRWQPQKIAGKPVESDPVIVPFFFSLTTRPEDRERKVEYSGEPRCLRKHADVDYELRFRLVLDGVAGVENGL